jgi:hypothetical protein
MVQLHIGTLADICVEQVTEWVASMDDSTLWLNL